MISGGTPAVAKLTRRAFGFRPSSCAFVEDITRAAAAPSLVCEELPAVTVPWAWKTGFNFARASREVSARGPSSLSKMVSVWTGFEPEPFRDDVSTVTGTISSVK